ncbi:MAG TPA: His/Gly/Thr/Pro-type tRNA ligase C-terminal domain-containing protein, partial [Anaerolineales bacterium]|nr:His/Gly/Thr/Pro-type tRNA ligase C-terminal domain-containing protein [Anaerolineales bacterium]
KGLVTVVADPSVSVGANFAAGANESGHHFINVNFPRDFKATIVTDIALAAGREGAGCARCGGTLRAQKAFTLGACRNAGEIESTYLAENGKPQRIWLGQYKMDVEQLMMAVVEQHHDEAGIVWPEAVAPFGIHLLRLGKAPETIAAADQLYAELQAAGKEVLYDDRDESAGVKFADADLIGAPLRVTVSDKSLKAGGAEVKRRNSTEKSIVPVESIKDMR